MGGDTEHEVGAVNTLLVCCVLGLILTVGYMLKKYKFYYLPESAASMILGMIIGGVARMVYPTESELSFLRFSPDMFFFLLLPPIIFEAGFNLKKKRFFRNLSTITLLAVMGTIISTFVIGLIIFAFAKAGAIGIDSTSPLQSLLFGALISAVDPVATLAIMGVPELQCNKMLYSLVFGESVLNDAVAIVLFRTFAQLTTRDSVNLNHWSSYVMLIGEFLGISIGSIIVGVLVGLAVSAIVFHSNIGQYPEKEITAMFLFAYAAYAVAESVELSGIMSLFFCGIIMSHYCWHNLSKPSKVTSHNAFASFSWVTETVVFMYMGMVLFTGEFKEWDAAFIVISIPVCLIARACNVFPLAFLANLRRKRPIPPKMMLVIWFAGLRGAIAFALALNMPAVAGWDNNIVVTTTLSIIFFTTIICGGATEPMLTKMGMKTSLSNEEAEAAMHQAIEDDQNGVVSGSAVTRTPHRAGGLHALWKRIDLRYMRPVFGGAKVGSNGDHHALHDDDHGHGSERLITADHHAHTFGGEDAQPAVGGDISGAGAGMLAPALSPGAGMPRPTSGAYNPPVAGAGAGGSVNDDGDLGGGGQVFASNRA